MKGRKDAEWAAVQQQLVQERSNFVRKNRDYSKKEVVPSQQSKGGGFVSSTYGR